MNHKHLDLNSFNDLSHSSRNSVFQPPKPRPQPAQIIMLADREKPLASAPPRRTDGPHRRGNRTRPARRRAIQGSCDEMAARNAPSTALGSFSLNTPGQGTRNHGRLRMTAPRSRPVGRNRNPDQASPWGDRVRDSFSVGSSSNALRYLQDASSIHEFTQ